MGDDKNNPSQECTNGMSNWKSLDERLNKGFGGDSSAIGDMVCRVLSYNYRNFNEFASKQWHDDGSASSFLSIEFLHDNLHVS